MSCNGLFNKTFNMKNKLFLIIFFSLLYSGFAIAADQTVEMLNRLNKESMVFEPKIVRVNVGDKVQWKATDKGHNVEFIKNGVPEGVDKFKSKYNKDTEYKFTIPGIYAYWCTPHKNMGMIGFVVVGEDKSNLEDIKKLKFTAKSNQRKLIIIGEMLELGDMSLKYHTEIVQKIFETTIDIVIFCGFIYKKILINLNLKSKKIFFFNNEIETLNFLINNILKNDIILVKGSNSSKTNKLFKLLLKTKEEE